MVPRAMFRKKLQLYVILFGLLWSALVVFSGMWEFRLEQREVIGQATVQARSIVERDLLFRRWATLHGGVYAPVSEKTPPNPYLAHIPERDLSTPSGRRLTLINPAYMTRQVHELGKEYGFMGHITSLKPINPGNRPDLWEHEALTRIEAGEAEVVAVASINGEPQLRFMRRLVVEQGCLKCHASQGYRVGDIRGGLSAAVPLAPYQQLMEAGQLRLVLSHLAVWLAGVLLFGLGAWRLWIQALSQEAVEVALRKSEERFALAASGASSGLWDWPDVGKDGRWWSAQWYRLLGYAEGELTPSWKVLRGLLHPEDLPRLLEALHQHFEEQQPFDLECRLRCKDGSFRWFRERGQALWDEAGRPRRMSGSIEDIHERRLAVQALEQAALEWSAAMDASDDVIYLLDCQRRIVRGNRSFYLLTGSSSQQVVGRHIVEVIHPHGEATPCPICRAQEELRDFKAVMEADHPDNPVGPPIEITVKIVRDSSGEPLSILMTLHDLSSARLEAEERSRLEAQLRQAQKMEAIGTLAGGIAHDFNNILVPILGYTEIVLEQLDPDSQLAGDLRQVLTATGRARELVRQILAFSRQGEQEVKPLMVQPVVKETLKLLRASVPATIEIRERISDCEPVLADPVQVQQVLINLCTNAYQAMRESGGVLSVSLETVDLTVDAVLHKTLPGVGKYVRLTVADTGPGIPVAIQDRIFEPYFTTKKQGEGTGLGLAVVHGIVKGMSGEISVHSEPGQGTEFRVHLPVAGMKAPMKSEATGPLPGGSERVLLVDDDPGIVRLVDQQLAGLGYRVSGFTDSGVAMAAFVSRPDDFDVVVTDMTMPGKTGAELAREVLRIRPAMPVVLCTGYSELITAEQARAIGIRCFIMKPVVRRELAVGVRAALDGVGTGG